MLVAGCALAALLAGRPAEARAAQAGQAPAHCHVGAYVASLHDLNVDGRTFAADLWLWSVCPNATFHPLQTMEFINAGTTSASFLSSETTAGMVWSSVKVVGTFRYNWNLTDFPFDHHTLAIDIEDSANDASTFAYDPDTANSAINPQISLNGWRVTGYRVTAGTDTYRTAFGDPSHPPGSQSAYSRLTIAITVARTGFTGFFKLTVVAYAAFLLALISYFLELDEPGVLTARMGILAGALFASAISLGTATSALGSENRLTLVGKIHIAAIAAILAATIVVTVSRQLLERRWTARTMRRLNVIAFAVTAVAFVVANVVLIALAIHNG